MRELSKAAGLFILLTLVFTYPLSVRPGSVLLADQPDFHLFVWTLGWIAHALATDPLSIFDANIFYPLRHTLAFSENLLGSGIFVAPVIWLTGDHVLAVNLVSLSSVALCGLGAYVLARRLGLSVGAAVVCGVIYAFSPPRFFRLGQLHLTTVQWIPFALAYLHTYFEHGKARDLKIAIAFFTFQALATGHGAVFLGIAMAGFVLYQFAVGHPVALARRVRDIGLTGVLLLLPALLIAIPYRIVQREMGLRRTLDNWTVPAVSFIASPATLHQKIISLFVPVSTVNDVALAFLFPGYLPVLLAVVGVTLGAARWRRHRMTDPTMFYALLAVFTLLLTVGPPLGIWPLVYWLPGFNFIRVPSRFLVLTVLALAVLGGIAFDRLTKSGARRYATPLAWGLTCLLLIEFSAIPLTVAPFSTRPPTADRWLADQRERLVIAEVPVSGAMRDHSTYMLHSMAHWQKTVHGFSGFDPPEHMRLYGAMRAFPDAESLRQMRAFGVTHVVVHIDRFDPQLWNSISPQLEGGRDLELVFQDVKSRVYRLRKDGLATGGASRSTR